jgi:hypothetical protein
MEIEAVLDRLNAADVSVWLDAEDKLRIDKGATPELKELVREHKQALIELKTAVRLMNTAGVRMIRLPLGHLALAYRLGTDLDEIRWSMKVLRKESMPLVINDEGLRSMTWAEWMLRQKLWTREGREEYLRQREAEQARPKSRRNAA